jgi:DNA-directed RNA polymerase subunit M/transcription elongation factor TFIIS
MSVTCITPTPISIKPDATCHSGMEKQSRNECSDHKKERKGSIVMVATKISKIQNISTTQQEPEPQSIRARKSPMRRINRRKKSVKERRGVMMNQRPSAGSTSSCPRYPICHQEYCWYHHPRLKVQQEPIWAYYISK